MDDNPESEYYEEEPSMQGNAMDNKESIVETLYNTEKRLDLLKRSMYGVAPLSFVEKQITALRAVINTTNAFTRRTDIECKQILYRATEAFILDMIKEPEHNINRKHYRTLAKSYEHALELFLGLPEGGHGARVLNDALAGISQKPEQKDAQSFTEWLKKKTN